MFAHRFANGTHRLINWARLGHANPGGSGYAFIRLYYKK